ncbi:MAG: PEP-CTERM sorting domain-containing protein [Planctomycetes bacterium]|nr:PEP-CTERM sorting domain-containing protein [Planctomycetota bacterium]
MKKLLVVAMLASFATSASAAEISLRFKGTDANTTTNTDALIPSVGGTVEVEVVWNQSVDAGANLGVGLVSFNLSGGPEDAAGGLQGNLTLEMGLSASLASSDLTGWATGGAAGAGFIGSPSTQIVLGSSSPDGVTAGGETVLGSFLITGNAVGVYTVYMNRDGVNPFAVGANDNGATFYAWSASPNPDNYNEFSIGDGFAGLNKGQNSIAMNIEVTPEPAALALLALGGIAVLRRRS